MKELEQYIEDHFDKKNYGDIKVTTSIDVGAVHKTTKQLSKELEIDLIIMGSRGKNHDVFDKTLGTASTNVLEMATCPVLLIPSGYPFVNIDNVLFTTNLDHGDPYELWRAIKLIDHHGIIIRCLYVAKDEKEKQNKELNDFGKYLVEHSPGVQTVFNVEVGNDIEEIIDDFADNFNVEMVIMHKSKKSFMQKIFGLSHTKKIAKTLKYPLMVIN
jgi:nucleotide-binding universal stress UspA family protein